jgi:hypothetical protein
MSWELASLVVTVAVGLLPFLMRRRRRHRTAAPAEQSWSLSVRIRRQRA